VRLLLDHPWALLALLLAVPLAWLALRSRPTLSSASVGVGLFLRLLVLGLLVLAIARPSVGWGSDAVSVLVVTDASASVPRERRDAAERAVAEAAVRRRPGDRLGAVSFAARPEILALPSVDPAGPLSSGSGDTGATDLAAALRMALAACPSDAANRILLVSDGNATAGDADAVAAIAEASGIPIDVVPVRYRHDREVVFERMAAPANARAGQSFDLRLTLRSFGASSGRVELRRNGEPVDLDTGSPSTGFPVRLEPGANLVVLPAVTDGAGAQRFEAEFVPDDPAMDAVPGNNLGAAVVFVGGTGRVAILEPDAGGEGDALAEALRRGNIEAQSVRIEQAMRGGLEWLAGFDAVVLANVPRWSVDNEFDRALHSACRDLGVGLVMLGGPESFGAGSWKGSETARALPVRMDPPQTRSLLRAAAALVIDCSGSMGQTVGATGMDRLEMANRAAVAGIGTLSRLDEAAVVAFSGEPDLVVPRGPVGDGTAMARQVMGITPCGGTNMYPAMDLALRQLLDSRAKTRHMVVLTDGQTSGSDEEGMAIVRRARAADITVSTIGVGDDVNDALLKALAAEGKGRYHAITDHGSASKLPQVFIREMAMEGRALIDEGNFPVTVAAGAGGPLSGVTALPAVRGYVLTAALGGTAQLGATVNRKEGSDPVVAWQNYGVGRSLAVTTDLSGRWGAAWRSWGGFQAFCEQSMRWAMRPADDRSIETSVTLDGDEARVRVRSAEERGGFAASMRIDARLVDPDGRVAALPLRQVGPGAFEGTFPARRAGAWMVSVAGARQSTDGAVRPSTTHASLSVPYPNEYRAVQDDGAALRRIAERSGGRVIEVDQLASADLFDRTGLAPARSVRQAWDLLAIAAAVLLLLDVAWRRIAFGRRDAQDLLARATGGAVAAGPQPSPQPVPAVRAPAVARPAASKPSAPAASSPASPAAEQGDTLSRLRAARDRSKK
jgi:Mg-chelatase subunit ChlD